MACPHSASCLKSDCAIYDGGGGGGCGYVTGPRRIERAVNALTAAIKAAGGKKAAEKD